MLCAEQILMFRRAMDGQCRPSMGLMPACAMPYTMLLVFQLQQHMTKLTVLDLCQIPAWLAL